MASFKASVAVLNFATCFQLLQLSVLANHQAIAYMPVSVSFYSGYPSVQLFQFDVPDKTLMSTWTLEVEQNKYTNCRHVKLSFHMQYGGYPVINPHNETYPPHFNINRTMPTSIDIISQSPPVRWPVKNPRPGKWYAVAYLEGLKSDVIEPKELRSDCHYALGVSHSVDILDPASINIMDLPLLTPTLVRLSHVTTKKHIYRFYVSSLAYQIEVGLTSCQVDGENVTHCPVTLLTRGTSMPLFDGEATSVNCSDREGGSCLLTVQKPQVDAYHYIEVETTVNSSVNFIMLMNTKDCISIQEASSFFEKQIEERTSSVCTVLPKMMKITLSTTDFCTEFRQAQGDMWFLGWNVLSDVNPLILPFDIDPSTDLGGTLKMKLMILMTHNSTEQEVTIIGCLQKGYYPLDLHNNINCDHSNEIRISNNDSLVERKEVVMYVPYPEAGHWFLALSTSCKEFSNNPHGQRVACQGTVEVQTNITLNQCVDGGCSGHGSCREYFSHMLLFTSCACEAGWRGYGCTDGTQAFTETEQWAIVLLLTLSNLFFIPAIIIAVKRTFYTEALVYFFNMFFSLFYHACDNTSLHKLCIVEYRVLSYCDFYASILSFWMTLIAMARLPHKATSALQMAGALVLSMAIEWEQHGMWPDIVPVATGCIILFSSWGFRCARRRTCYPSKRRYVTFLLPGLTLSLVAIAIETFLERDENYQYTHSAWHMLIMLSVALLLPPAPYTREKKRTENYSPVSSEENVCCESINLLQAESQEYSNIQEPHIDL